MKFIKNIKVRITALFLTVVGLVISFRQARAAFPLMPLAGLGSIPFIGKGLGKIEGFKELAEAALQGVLEIKREIEIIVLLLTIIVVIYCIVLLIKELRRDKIKRIITNLSGIYTALVFLRDGGVSGDEKKQCVESIAKLGDEINMLLELKFLQKRLGIRSYRLVRGAIEKIKNAGEVSDGHIAIVTQYLQFFEAMARW